jgi:hypothetical protein
VEIVRTFNEVAAKVAAAFGGNGWFAWMLGEDHL